MARKHDRAVAAAIPLQSNTRHPTPRALSCNNKAFRAAASHSHANHICQSSAPSPGTCCRGAAECAIVINSRSATGASHHAVCTDTFRAIVVNYTPVTGALEPRGQGRASRRRGAQRYTITLWQWEAQPGQRSSVRLGRVVSSRQFSFRPVRCLSSGAPSKIMSWRRPFFNMNECLDKS
jgi:hypothetical protein